MLFALPWRGFEIFTATMSWISQVSVGIVTEVYGVGMEGWDEPLSANGNGYLLRDLFPLMIQGWRNFFYSKLKASSPGSDRKRIL